MTYAYPSPATQKSNGIVDKGNERVLGMSYFQWLVGKQLEGLAARMLVLERTEPEDIELIVQRVVAVAERLAAISAKA